MIEGEYQKLFAIFEVEYQGLSPVDVQKKFFLKLLDHPNHPPTFRALRYRKILKHLLTIIHSDDDTILSAFGIYNFILFSCRTQHFIKPNVLAEILGRWEKIISQENETEALNEIVYSFAEASKCKTNKFFEVFISSDVLYAVIGRLNVESVIKVAVLLEESRLVSKSKERYDLLLRYVDSTNEYAFTLCMRKFRFPVSDFSAEEFTERYYRIIGFLDKPIKMKLKYKVIDVLDKILGYYYCPASIIKEILENRFIFIILANRDSAVPKLVNIIHAASTIRMEPSLSVHVNACIYQLAKSVSDDEFTITLKAKVKFIITGKFDLSQAIIDTFMDKNDDFMFPPEYKYLDYKLI